MTDGPDFLFPELPATPSLFPSEISNPTQEIPTLLPVILGIWLPLEQR